jgi:cytochrome o ubiquinol oxidase subunit 2
MNFQLLNPKGFIASQQRDLIIFAVVLMLVAVVPTFVLLYSVAWKYREGNKSKYTPNWDHNIILQGFWWVFLASIISVLAVYAWNTTHALDPRKPIVSNVDPITIQVIALEWKWLFIYPEQNIATVNFVQFPEDTPILFEITAQAPMNSFWIPQLGGQMYAMNGMRTTLNMMAEETGDYRGMSSNISGEGFSGMRFTAKASSETDFDSWVATVKLQSENLDYNHIASPSKNNSQATYVLAEPNLFESIVNKYIGHYHAR